MINGLTITAWRSTSSTLRFVIHASARAKNTLRHRTGWQSKWAFAMAIAATSACQFLPVGFAVAEEKAFTPISCNIGATLVNGFLRLQAVGRSDTLVSGHYVFSISKRNSTGLSENTESGDFTLAPGQDRVLATVVLEAAADRHFSADLSLNWGSGKTSCHAP